MFSRAILTICLWTALSAASSPPDYLAAARELDAAISQSYAYLDKLPDGALPQSAILSAEREAVSDEDSLLHYAENRIASLADHHAITGSSFADSWAVIPTYADLWILKDRDRYIVDSVRENSPAMKAGIKAGDRLLATDGIAIDAQVQAFWSKLGLGVTLQRAQYAARILAAGRRDRHRVLTIVGATGETRTLTMPSLYGSLDSPDSVTVTRDGRRTTIRFNNSLGDMASIKAFDGILAELPSDHDLVIDLRETPSGGNTTVARAILGWFVNRPTAYQIHNRPDEERQTGISRQWVEQVLPRKQKYRDRLPTILVGRWTGSMGEGIAIGFAAMGASVHGTPMAGLNGSVEDIPVGNTDLSIKLPTERLMTTTYQPREDFVPASQR